MKDNDIKIAIESAWKEFERTGVISSDRASNLLSAVTALKVENEQLKNPWVSVEIERPDIGQNVLVFMQHREHAFSSIPVVSCTFTKYGFERACVTHWMPLPMPMNVCK